LESELPAIFGAQRTHSRNGAFCRARVSRKRNLSAFLQLFLRRLTSKEVFQFKIFSKNRKLDKFSLVLKSGCCINTLKCAEGVFLKSFGSSPKWQRLYGKIE
jgi:hypothetical protein